MREASVEVHRDRQQWQSNVGVYDQRCQGTGILVSGFWKLKLDIGNGNIGYWQHYFSSASETEMTRIVRMPPPMQ